MWRLLVDGVQNTLETLVFLHTVNHNLHYVNGCNVID